MLAIICPQDTGRQKKPPYLMNKGDLGMARGGGADPVKQIACSVLFAVSTGMTSSTARISRNISAAFKAAASSCLSEEELPTSSGARVPMWCPSHKGQHLWRRWTLLRVGLAVISSRLSSFFLPAGLVSTFLCAASTRTAEHSPYLRTVVTWYRIRWWTMGLQLSAAWSNPKISSRFCGNP